MLGFWFSWQQSFTCCDAM